MKCFTLRVLIDCPTKVLSDNVYKQNVVRLLGRQNTCIY